MKIGKKNTTHPKANHQLIVFFFLSSPVVKKTNIDQMHHRLVVQ